MLLMQSFAVWHHTIHFFHVNSDQCRNFEAVSHTPILDITPVISPVLIPSVSLFLSTVYVVIFYEQVRDNFSIRAPPYFS